MEAHAQYTRRLKDCQAESAREEIVSRRIGNARLLTAITEVVVAFFVFGEVVISPWWLAAPAVIFAVLVVFHSRVDERRDCARRTAAFYKWGLARLENRWAGKGESGERFRDSAHVYADDLDVFGTGSLFELLSTARTRAGEDTLAQWLLNPALRDEALARQQAVDELRNRLDLREQFAIVGEPARSSLHAEALSVWGEAPVVLFPKWARLLAPVLAALVLLTFALYMSSILTRTPFLAALLAVLVFTVALRKKVDEIAEGVETPAHDLKLLAAMLNRLEGEQFKSELLQNLLARIQVQGLTASLQTAKLQKLFEKLDWEENMFFKPIAAALLWRPQVAMAVEKWRGMAGHAIRNWITAVAEFEALLSLSSHAYEHPADPFPVFKELDGWFEAEGIGHPLMSESQCVRNDVQLGGEVRMLVVSGSNMSGKSTLLRSVALNTVLAWAGAPVRANRLKISPVSLGASIRVVDSLQDGRSRFYTEITKLRQILDLTSGDRAVLFLIDEMLSGTNSHDRRIGAEAIVRSLVDRGAIGMITTHDLALAHIVDALHGRAANVHFADTIEDGKLHFDYRLHPGVVKKSNALELMRSVGLEV